MRRAHYGVDAPGLVRGFLVVGVAAGCAGYALLRWAGEGPWLHRGADVFFVVATYALFMCVYMLWGSLVVKVRGRDAIFNLITWTDHEHVLDVGCGRGLLLIGAAQRLSHGKAVGLDLWMQEDQSANELAATLQNAAIEGVADRVSVVTGDMRQLPFADASFDGVLSSWAVHNLEQKHDREDAITGMIRVLKPGGWLLLNDIANRHEYEQHFVRLGLLDVRVVVASRVHDLFSSTVSFGSFRPATVVGRKR